MEIEEIEDLFDYDDGLFDVESSQQGWLNIVNYQEFY